MYDIHFKKAKPQLFSKFNTLIKIYADVAQLVEQCIRNA